MQGGYKNYTYLFVIIFIFSCKLRNEEKFLGSEKINENNYLDLYNLNNWGVGGDVFAIYLRNPNLKYKILLYKFDDHQGIDHKLSDNKLVIYKIDSYLSKVEDSLVIVLK